jgi:hypothetical protein
MNRDPIPWEEPTRNSDLDVMQRESLEQIIENSELSNVELVKQFPKFIQSTYLRKFISRYELYKKILNLHGSIVECGALGADGVFAWAHFAEIFEPYNHLRKIIAFDSFSGFPSVAREDKSSKTTQNFLTVGGLKSDNLNSILECRKIFNLNRPLKHIERIELIQGDAIQTIPTYIEKHPETLVSLLWLDFDLFEPTKIAIKSFLPRMAKNSIIAFDELNHPLWPGESVAYLQSLDIAKYTLHRFPFGSTVSFIEL